MSGDKKVSELQTLVTPAGSNYLLVIDNTSGFPVSKRITLDSFLPQLPSNTAILGTFTAKSSTKLLGSVTVNNDIAVVGETTTRRLVVSSNSITIATSFTPANSSITGLSVGQVFWDANYLYIRVSNTAIKRVALSSF